MGDVNENGARCPSSEERDHSQHLRPDQATDEWSCSSVDPRHLHSCDTSEDS